MTFKDELAKVLAINDEDACGQALVKLCQDYKDQLPLPGVVAEFDQAMWTAAEHLSLSGNDEQIVSKIVGNLLGKITVKSHGFQLKSLLGSAKDAAQKTWQEMSAALAWQQMVPASVLRSVGGQTVTLGTMQKQLAEANIQLNLGWLVDQNHLRILLQAKDQKEKALPDVELRVKEIEKGVVFSRKTNQDGAVVAPNVPVAPGQYQIQVLWLEHVAETPIFVI